MYYFPALTPVEAPQKHHSYYLFKSSPCSLTFFFCFYRILCSEIGFQNFEGHFGTWGCPTIAQLFSWRILSGNKCVHVMCFGLIPVFPHRSCWQTSAHSTLLHLPEMVSYFIQRGKGSKLSHKHNIILREYCKKKMAPPRSGSWPNESPPHISQICFELLINTHRDTQTDGQTQNTTSFQLQFRLNGNVKL